MGNEVSHGAIDVRFRYERATPEEIRNATMLNLPIHCKKFHSRLKQWPDREWPERIGSKPDFQVLEALIKLVSPLASLPVAEPEHEVPSAIEMVQRIKDAIETHIHATVGVGGWVTSWARSVIAFIASAFPRCSDILLFAGQGGSACQEELVLIYWIMAKLGFRQQPGDFNDDQTNQFNDGLLFYSSAWRLRRKDRSLCRVTLNVVGDTRRIHVLHDVAAYVPNSRLPNLVQVAVVSCPEDSIKALSQKISEDLAKAMDLAARKGYRPEGHWTRSEAACRAYYEYFEMKHVTLAEHGISPTKHLADEAKGTPRVNWELESCDD